MKVLLIVNIKRTPPNIYIYSIYRYRYRKNSPQKYIYIFYFKLIGKPEMGQGAVCG